METENKFVVAETEIYNLRLPDMMGEELGDKVDVEIKVLRGVDERVRVLKGVETEETFLVAIIEANREGDTIEANSEEYLRKYYLEGKDKLNLKIKDNLTVKEDDAGYFFEDSKGEKLSYDDTKSVIQRVQDLYKKLE